MTRSNHIAVVCGSKPKETHVPVRLHVKSRATLVCEQRDIMEEEELIHLGRQAISSSLGVDRIHFDPK